jgi:hypothetical protein
VGWVDDRHELEAWVSADRFANRRPHPASGPEDPDAEHFAQ